MQPGMVAHPDASRVASPRRIRRCSSGIASCAAVCDDPAIAEVFGLWVDPATRQAGVAWSLMEAATQLATTQNRNYLYYWVGTENTRAIAFASNFGFRPSPDRRPARLTRAGFGTMEMAMVLPVGSDPAAVPNPTMSSFGYRRTGVRRLARPCPPRWVESWRPANMGASTDFPEAAPAPELTTHQAGPSSKVQAAASTVENAQLTWSLHRGAGKACDSRDPTWWKS